MISAFGVTHEISKAAKKWYHRDKDGRFAAWDEEPKEHVGPNGETNMKGVPFDDHEYEMEAESTRVDYKHMTRVEGHPKDHKDAVRQMELAHDYYRYRGEHEMADEVADNVYDSMKRHKKKLKSSGVDS